MNRDYLIVHKRVLPDYFEKVLRAKELVEASPTRDISAAVREVGISRSTYYKYKDYVYSPGEGEIGRKAVISMLLSHEIGVLSAALQHLSGLGISVLTISQSMPIRDVASVSMTLDIGQMDCTVEEAIQVLELLSGVENVTLVAIE